MANHGTTAQEDLFDGPPPDLKLGVTERAKLLEQLQLLLLEGIATTEARRRADDDQDHA
jgi:hypothetical protein